MRWLKYIHRQGQAGFVTVNDIVLPREFDLARGAQQRRNQQEGQASGQKEISRRILHFLRRRY